MEKAKKIFEGVIKPIIQLIIVFVPPLILTLLLTIWMLKIGLAEAILSFTMPISYTLPYYFIFLILWLIILIKLRKIKL
jgi:hypothetical protein